MSCGGKPLFTIEDRGDSLFCQVGYFGPPEGLKQITVDGAPRDCSGDFVLVSIENGIHQTIGFHIDSFVPRTGDARRIPLAEVHDRLVAAGLAEVGQSLPQAA